ncbi:uncharacterized protein LOC136091495 [Hydra vulgaris]|uniref:Uncharacterized protein LOC136091495 n=1 Tax=Hydra vulgaris TaxID=6087 RepID=A0ABM4DKX6_HYDVU
MFKFVMTKNSYELFYRAVTNNDISRTKLILDEALKDPRFNIDEINDDGLTALQSSCFAGNLDIVKMLVSKQANWKIQDREGNTLLHAAAMMGRVEVVKYLLSLGIKPVVKADNGLMPIDCTENISVIVVLLRAMLDQGYLYEMQDYMLDHPMLKRKIFQELEVVKCKENEKKEILKDLPYTSHTAKRNHTNSENARGNAENTQKMNRSINTFTSYSESPNISNLIEQMHDSRLQANLLESHLSRQNSLNSLSSKSSRSSHNSVGGILKNTDNNMDPHSFTQQYLESRFPPSKSVTFESDLITSKDLSKSRCFSTSCDNVNEFRETEEIVDESIYENVLRKPLALSPISESCLNKLVDNSPPPPLPPREPTNFEPPSSDIYSKRNKYFDEISQYHDRQFGSETDSGIDINETQGRLFALSLEDKFISRSSESLVDNIPKHRETFSQPIGLFYSRDKQTTIVKQQVSSDDNLPCGFFIRTHLKTNPKHMSWNGRSLQKELDELQPWYNSYVKDRHGYSTDTNFSTKYVNESNKNDFNNKHAKIDTKANNYNIKERVRAMSTGNINNSNDVFLYNTDHHPDVML